MVPGKNGKSLSARGRVKSTLEPTHGPKSGKLKRLQIVKDVGWPHIAMNLPRNGIVHTAAYIRDEPAAVSCWTCTEASAELKYTKRETNKEAKMAFITVSQLNFLGINWWEAESGWKRYQKIHRNVPISPLVAVAGSCFLSGKSIH